MTKNRLRKFLIGIALLAIFISPVLVLAQGQNPGQTVGQTVGQTPGQNPPCGNPGQLCDPLKGKFGSIPDLIKKILEGAIKIGIPIIALALVYCGFLFVAARGKPEAIKHAKDALLYTLIGAAVLLGSWAIAQLISETVIELGK